MANGLIGHIKIGQDEHQLASTAYFECDTHQMFNPKIATSPSEATFTNDSLVTGITIYVKFTNGNAVPSPQLQVGSSTAKTVIGNSFNSYIWESNTIVEFTYDGTAWVCNDVLSQKTNFVNSSAYATISIPKVTTQPMYVVTSEIDVEQDAFTAGAPFSISEGVITANNVLTGGGRVTTTGGATAPIAAVTGITNVEVPVLAREGYIYDFYVVDVRYSSGFIFTHTYTYQTIKNYSWTNWCQSTYNVNQYFFIGSDDSDNEVVCYNDGNISGFLLNDTGDHVYSDDDVECGNSYSLELRSFSFSILIASLGSGLSFTRYFDLHPNMTWSQWCQSDFNDGSLYVSNGVVKYSSSPYTGTITLSPGSSNYVQASSIIISNHQYGFIPD